MTVRELIAELQTFARDERVANSRVMCIAGDESAKPFAPRAITWIDEDSPAEPEPNRDTPTLWLLG